MKIAGIIAEYNPFHNGHLHHLKQTRARTGCDAVVAVMSGNFVQRGEPALFDKWARTRMALATGVDAVFELPAFYALQPAEWFACGGVSVLHGLGADALSFGAEVPDPKLLRALADTWEHEPEEVSAAVKAGLAQGKTHPRARAEALQAYLLRERGDTAQALSSPNLVLAAMYLRWMEKLDGAMEPCAVQRVAAGYHDEELSGPIASATAVRRSTLRGDDAWRRAVPPAALSTMEEELAGGGAVREEDLGRVFLFLARMGAALPDTAEGLDRRMEQAARQAGTLGEFYGAVKCKRYTLARIRRAAMQTVLGITPGDVEALRCARPAYARLLGYSRRVDGLVNELAARATIPFVVRPARFTPEDGGLRRLWEIDRRASDTYSLAQGRPSDRDFTEKLIVF